MPRKVDQFINELQESMTHSNEERILLAHFKTIPVLVEGKVIIYKDDKFVSIGVGKYTSIQDGFNPEDYSILVKEEYMCIVPSRRAEKMPYLVNKAYRTHIPLSDRKIFPLREERVELGDDAIDNLNNLIKSYIL